MSERTCIAPGCEKQVPEPGGARGMCRKHYKRFMKTGTTDRPSVEESFWSRVDASGVCWEYTGSRDKEGYGKARMNGKGWLAHRLAYTLLVGEIAKDLQLDHLCRNHSCVNPDHLEPVTQAENMRRGVAAHMLRARAASITHCKHGHPYTEENTYRQNGKRYCRACKLKRVAERYRKQKEAACLT